MERCVFAVDKEALDVNDDVQYSATDAKASHLNRHIVNFLQDVEDKCILQLLFRWKKHIDDAREKDQGVVVEAAKHRGQ